MKLNKERLREIRMNKPPLGQARHKYRKGLMSFLDQNVVGF